MPRAVVCEGVDTVLRVEALDLARPRAGEVGVTLSASAVCHSDLLVHNGTLQSSFPMVMGHEGAGIVRAIGEGVTGLEPGDHVVVATMPQCGECLACMRDERYLCERVAGPMVDGSLLDGTYRWSRADGTQVRQQAGVGAFAEEIVIPALSAVQIDRGIPFRCAALAGCRLLTGMGAALNTAQLQGGETVAVIGCGIVGLSVIQAARIAGASEVIAIDLRRDKLDLALSVGATQIIAGDADDVVRETRGIVARGVDVAFDVVGIEATFLQALRLSRRGGAVILVGVPSPAARFALPAYMGVLAGAKTIKGAWLGWSSVQRDIPRFLDYYLSGELLLDELTETAFAIDEINEAFAAVRQGETACAIVEYGQR